MVVTVVVVPRLRRRSERKSSRRPPPADGRLAPPGPVTFPHRRSHWDRARKSIFRRNAAPAAAGVSRLAGLPYGFIRRRRSTPASGSGRGAASRDRAPAAAGAGAARTSSIPRATSFTIPPHPRSGFLRSWSLNSTGRLTERRLRAGRYSGLEARRQGSQRQHFSLSPVAQARIADSASRGTAAANEIGFFHARPVAGQEACLNNGRVARVTLRTSLNRTLTRWTIRTGESPRAARR